jgi:hypothetical protein
MRETRDNHEYVSVSQAKPTFEPRKVNTEDLDVPTFLRNRMK